MLKIGQKVKLHKNLKHYETHVPSPHAGEITTIIGFEGIHEIGIGYKDEVYTVACMPTSYIVRDSLYPIDDEPCDAEFLEEFKGMIYVKG